MFATTTQWWYYSISTAKLVGFCVLELCGKNKHMATTRVSDVWYFILSYQYLTEAIKQVSEPHWKAFAGCLPTIPHLKEAFYKDLGPLMRILSSSCTRMEFLWWERISWCINPSGWHQSFRLHRKLVVTPNQTEIMWFWGRLLWSLQFGKEKQKTNQKKALPTQIQQNFHGHVKSPEGNFPYIEWWPDATRESQNLDPFFLKETPNMLTDG